MISLALKIMYLSSKHLILLKECEIDMEDDQYIHVILANLGIAYYVFVSTFYLSRESLVNSYMEPSLKSFCDYLIREQDNLLNLGVINTIGTSNKALVTQ
jgi:hypothetical protein